MKRSPSSRVSGFPVESVQVAAAILGICVLHSTAAAAAIVVSSDPRWGSDSIITDTVTKLQWLQLNNPAASTVNLSEAAVAGQLATTYKGWKIATSAQVVSLFNDFDLPATVNSPVVLLDPAASALSKIDTFTADFAPGNFAGYLGDLCVPFAGCFPTTYEAIAAGFTLDGGVVGLGFADEGTGAQLPGAAGRSAGDYVVFSSPPGINPAYTDVYWGTFLVRREPRCEELAEQPAIIVGPDRALGPHSIITDTVTNLQWRKFDSNWLQIGMSESTVAASLPTMYGGWKIATPAQVASLFKDFGLPITVNTQVEGITGQRRLSDINTLISDFAPGNTYPIETPSGPVASPTLSGFTFDGSVVGFGYATLVGTPAVGFYGVFSSGIDGTYAASGVGTFLVRPAPPSPPCISEGEQ